MLHRQNHRAFAFLVSAMLIAASCGGSDAADDAVDTTPDTTAEAEPTAEPEPAVDDADEDESAESAETTVAPLEDDEQLTSEGEGASADDADLEPQAGGEIDWALTNDGTGFDTTTSVGAGSIRVVTAISDPLVSLETNADWAPNLAQSLTPNDDFTSWTITMRPGVTFHDGEPLNAEAMRANLQTYKDSPTIGFGLAPVETITAVDDMSVQVDMNTPWAAFPFSLVGQLGWMVSPSTIGTNETFVGTGPFMLENWTPGDSARVVRNPDYWRADEGLPYLDAINFKFVTEQNVRRQALEAGDVQGFLSPGTDDIVDYLEDDDVDVWIGTAGANEYIWALNTAAPPFDDIRVRRAMAHAIDQDLLIETFRSGLTEPATGPLNPSDRWYAPNNYPEFDPAAAQALVDEYEAEVGPIEFEVDVEPSSEVTEIAEVMLSFLSDVGIDGTINQIGAGQAIGLALADDFQALSAFAFGAPDPDGVYVNFHSSGGVLNYSNLVSADIDEGLDKGRQNVDEALRQEGYAQFLGALGDEVPMIWLDHLNGVEAVATIPEIHGIGSPGTLPDGEAQLPMTNGVFFAWTEVWLEQ